ncbi:A/G-specific adenine glycosylase [Sphingobacteriales bacterium UPWRP_1]|nr:A/G-specific adenine glycosylase [Sphingobacteriales bacterium TSM_CSM]PSJ74147.1 A/G-specific adenine glycosylase [Sphingobacteriales bacterium UPWRP_1]
MHVFTQQLLQWQAGNTRQLPWKNTNNAYIIWLSEVILQQTRVEQGMPYFLKFAARYPSVSDLANAPDDEVMHLWEGLGYYSRARNMLHTARYIVRELNGVFPQTYEEIRRLKGVGDYTAAAIASFAYGLPYAVVDGNVYRVLSRYFGIDTPVDHPKGKQQFSQLAQQLLYTPNPGLFNQAIMDFGALQCTPAKPNCPTCPLNNSCVAYADGRVAALPVKSKKIVRKNRFFNFVILHTPSGGVLLRKRTAKDIWENLYEFLLLETDGQLLTPQTAGNHHFIKQLTHHYRLSFRSASVMFKQQLTHQTIYACFFEADIAQPDFFTLLQDFFEIPENEINRYALPKIINNYLTNRKNGAAALQLHLPLL